MGPGSPRRPRQPTLARVTAPRRPAVVTDRAVLIRGSELNSAGGRTWPSLGCKAKASKIRGELGKKAEAASGAGGSRTGFEGTRVPENTVYMRLIFS